MNHVRYEQRLDFIRNLMKTKFSLEPSAIEPLEYDAECPFPFNNFIYHLSLSSPPTNPTPSQSFTTPIPTTVSSLVVRLSNPLSELEHSNRIENEVVAMSFFRDALKSKNLQSLVPEVYGWGGCTGPDGEGWILMEYKEGILIYDRDLDKYTPAQHRHVFSQFANAYSAIQSFQLPSSITHFGGSNIVNGDTIVGGKMTLPYGGPFETYLDLWKGMISAQLVDADKSSVVKGWQPSGLRTRIDNFLSSPTGLQALVSSLLPNQSSRHILHGDFTTANLLFDPSTLDITAILDFDWAYISAHLGEEFLRSLGSAFYVPPKASSVGFDAFLRECILSGTFSSIPSSLTPSEKELQRYDAAKILHGELGKHSILRPCELDGFVKLEDMWRFQEGLAPFQVCAEPMIKRLGEEKCEKKRVESEDWLKGWLERKGF